MFHLPRSIRHRVLIAAVLPAIFGLTPPAANPAAADVVAPATPATPATPALNSPPAFRWVSPAAPASLNYESLGAALLQSGYKVEARVLEGRSMYLVSSDRPKCTIRVWAFINTKEKLVCFDAVTGGPVDFNSPAAAAHVRRVLEKNAEIAPAFFAISPTSSRLRLMRQLPVAGATPASVAAALVQFADTIEEASPLWGQTFASDRTGTAAGTAEKGTGPGAEKGIGTNP